MKRILSYAFILAFIPVFSLCAAGDEDTKEKQVLKALHETTEYINNVLINDEGISRCDYNIPEGKWYDYEPPWHTGQAIYALLESYRITGEEKYLETAKRAGDWWVGLEIKDHPKLKGMVRSAHGDHAGVTIVFATISNGSAYIPGKRQRRDGDPIAVTVG